MLTELYLMFSYLKSEEVFDFSRDEMTQAKIVELKNSLNQEFNMIFQLCEFVLDKAERPSLIAVTLDALLRYLSWIPLGYVFETKLLETIILKVNNMLPLNSFINFNSSFSQCPLSVTKH